MSCPFLRACHVRNKSIESVIEGVLLFTNLFSCGEHRCYQVTQCGTGSDSNAIVGGVHSDGVEAAQIDVEPLELTKT